MRLTRRLLSTGMLLTPVFGHAQRAVPDRPIRLIVPFPPGGGVDLTARLLADPLARELGQGVVVENRGGAGGVIGVEAMANSPADGLTLSLTGAGTITAGPHLRRLPYDPFGLAHVTRLVRMPFIIALRADFPAPDRASGPPPCRVSWPGRGGMSCAGPRAASAPASTSPASCSGRCRGCRW